ncbi:MAG: thioredoxin family protein [Cyclonatronaceae bacterium]
MNSIKVLGPGCAKCKTLESNVAQALSELNSDIKLEKVTDYEEIMSYDIMSTPALVVDEKVLFAGSVPSVKDLKAKLA